MPRRRRAKAKKNNTPPVLPDKARPKLNETKAVAKVKKSHTKALIFFGISVVSIVLMLLIYRFVNQSVPTHFTSKLTQVGGIELGYAEKQSEKVSPLCGCYDVGEWGRWRGITFSARNIEIERKGSLPVTGYLIFPADPSATRFHPEFFKMKVSYYLIETYESERFNPKYLLSEQFPAHYKVLKKEESDEGFVQVFSGAKLNISLLGDKPLGSWIPMENSNVSIKYLLRQDISQPTTTVIKEKYLESTKEELDHVWDENGFYSQRNMSMPLGDFLGPNVVFWNEEEPTSILASTKVLHIRDDGVAQQAVNNGKKLVKGIVVNPPFAVRVVAVPFNNDVYIRSTGDAPKREENNYSFIGSQGRFDSGEATLKIYTPDNQAAEFDKIYQSMKQEGTTVSNFKTYYVKEIAGGKMVFRYPPIPPNYGFNIFGNVQKLKIDSAMGNLMIGTRPFNLEAPASLELRDIQKIEVQNGVMEVPIQIGVAETPAKIQLSATAEIFVNNESITKRVDNNKTLSDFTMLLSTVVGIIASLVSAIIAAKELTKKPKQ